MQHFSKFIITKSSGYATSEVIFTSYLNLGRWH